MNTETIKYIALTLATEGHCDALAQFYSQNTDVLQEYILNVLLYLPETVSLEEYTPIIDMYQDGLSKVDDNRLDYEPFDIDLAPRLVRRTMSKLELSQMSLDQFAERRSRNIDSLCGVVREALKLLTRYKVCTSWCDGIIRPLCTLSEVNVASSIAELESLDAFAIVGFLESADEVQSLHLVIDEIILPLSEHRQCHSNLGLQLRKYLLTESMSRVLEISSIFVQSNAPEIIKHDVAGGAMLVCYRTTYDLQLAKQILTVLRNSLTLEEGSLSRTSDSAQEFLQNLTKSEGSCFITPSKSSLTYLEGVLEDALVLKSMARALTVKLGNFSSQQNDLKSLLSSAGSSDKLKELRKLLLARNLFSLIPRIELESSFLKAMLRADHLELAKSTYVTTAPRPLPSKAVEACLVECFHELFDKARSINRRDLNQASQVLGVIHPKHKNETIRRLQLLVDTVMELSAYKGAHRYTPAKIRSFKAEDTLDFFSSILQEGTNYKKHFRLLGMFQNLAIALQLELQEERFKELVINAALAADDLPAAIAMVETIEVDYADPKESESWRLFYLVCKYPSEERAIVEKQFEMLSFAMALCPSENILELTELFGRLTAIETSETQTSIDRPQFTRETSNLEDGSDAVETIAMPEWKLFEAAQAATRAARQYLPKTQDETGSRVRKRDQLAGLVGVSAQAVESKFTSGLGWLIGADQSEQ